MAPSSVYSRTPQTAIRIPEVIFYFDVVCPFAFIASERIDDIAKFTGAKVIWKPVLLGALYDLTNAPQGKDGSSMAVPMPQAKRDILSADFQRELNRYQLPLKFPANHPVKSVDAGRLLSRFPEEYRPTLAHAIFRAYWYDSADISSRATLLRIARRLNLSSVAAPTHAGPFSLNPVLPFALDESVFLDVETENSLRANTREAFERGAFGVPCFWIEERKKFFWGQDRMHLLEAELISIKVSKPIENIRQLERLHPRCLRTPAEARSRTLKFWFDFSSPWAFLGWSQLERLQRDAGPGLKIVYKPFLLGALFKEIGTPMLPGQALIPAKQKYASQDILDWVRYWSAVNKQEYPPIEGPNFRWPDEFPIRSVTALRVAILDPSTIPAIYRAAWEKNAKISDPLVLEEVLQAASFDGKKLVAQVTTGPQAASIKSILKENTDEAVRIGICGAPTFQVGKTLIWGGDKMNVVADLVTGWVPEVSHLRATVSGFHGFDYRL